jgi:hypothetical protein
VAWRLNAAAQSPYLVPDWLKGRRPPQQQQQLIQRVRLAVPAASNQFFWCNYQNHPHGMSRYMNKTDELYTDM